MPVQPPPRRDVPQRIPARAEPRASPGQLPDNAVTSAVRRRSAPLPAPRAVDPWSLETPSAASPSFGHRSPTKPRSPFPIRGSRPAITIDLLGPLPQPLPQFPDAHINMHYPCMMMPSPTGPSIPSAPAAAVNLANLYELARHDMLCSRLGLRRTSSLGHIIPMRGIARRLGSLGVVQIQPRRPLTWRIPHQRAASPAPRAPGTPAGPRGSSAHAARGGDATALSELSGRRAGAPGHSKHACS